MPKKTLNLVLQAEQVDMLLAAFGSDGAKPLTEDDLTKIAELAVASWVDIFGGRKRFRSLTEQHLDWLSSIYTAVLPNEEPSELRLFGRLNFPYGQGSYLARVLREQRGAIWRRKSLQALKDALSAKTQEAKEWVKAGRGSERMNFLLSKGSKTELSTIVGSLALQGNNSLSPIRIEGSMGGYSYASIAAADLEPIVALTTKLLGGG